MCNFQLFRCCQCLRKHQAGKRLAQGCRGVTSARRWAVLGGFGGGTDMTEFVFQGDPGLGGSGGRAEKGWGWRLRDGLGAQEREGSLRQVTMGQEEEQWCSWWRISTSCVSVFSHPRGCPLYRCRTWLRVSGWGRRAWLREFPWSSLQLGAQTCLQPRGLRTAGNEPVLTRLWGDLCNTLRAGRIRFLEPST